MSRFKRFLFYLPILGKAINRKYYASGLGVYVMNLIFKHIFRINIGADILFNYTSRVNRADRIKIKLGDNSDSVYRSFVSSGGCYYQAINGIEIGEGTIWAFNCQFISSNHSYKDLTKNVQGRPIIIGNYVWIASNCVILPEVQLGDYCIVGAGSVITKSFPPYKIIAGVPAKAIANRCKVCFDKVSLDDDLCMNCKA